VIGGTSLSTTAVRLLVFGAPARVDRVCRELRKAGWSPAIASAEGDDVSAMLSEGAWDVVVACQDSGSRPDRDLRRIVAAAGDEIPVIALVPAAAAARAGDLMRAGVRDCVSEDQLGRLVPAVAREAVAARARRERRALEVQLRHAQRMEALGRLASGIAHDFSNLLTAVTGYTELLLDRLDPHDSLREVAEDIRSASMRASALTRQLLTFSRRQEPRPAVLDLNVLVTDMERLLRRVIGEHITLIVTLAPGESRVTADRGEIEQVVMNLVVNARDAMPQGGDLRLTTAHVDVGAAESRNLAHVAPGPYVSLEVQDTGLGIDEETQERLFEPFFTTKEASKGTGLGLSTVQAIVRANGGVVTVHSRPGEGSTFRILLPRAAQPVTAPVTRRGRPALPRGTETVLLVEDETGVRELVRDLLGRCGYTVFEATDAADAIAVFARHRDDIHLLVTDVVMPQMNGRQLAERFLAERPALKVLYMSGYTDEPVIADDAAPAPAFLQKPFTPDVLARAVREVLDGRAPSA
jgi:signal transduction histidine kinase/ActR/RegA family two-component response regulator